MTLEADLCLTWSEPLIVWFSYAKAHIKVGFNGVLVLWTCFADLKNTIKRYKQVGNDQERAQSDKAD